MGLFFYSKFADNLEPATLLEMIFFANDLKAFGLIVIKFTYIPTICKIS